MTTLTPRLDSIESGKNLMINGGFDIWQRLGANSLNVANNSLTTWTADRWFVQNTGATNVTAVRSTDVPTVAQSGYHSRYSLQLTNVSSLGATTFVNIQHRLEGFDYQKLHAGKARLQFWCKSSVTGQYSLALQNASQNRGTAYGFTISSANTWEKKAIDITFDTTGTWNFDNGVGLTIYITLGFNTSLAVATPGTWQGGQVFGLSTQVNWAGTAGATFLLNQASLVPTGGSSLSDADIPFSRAGKTFQEELAMCQRYYEKSYELDTAPGTINQLAGMSDVTATTQSTGVLITPIRFAVPKRAAPTMTAYLYATGATGSWDYGRSGASGTIAMSIGTVSTSQAAFYTGNLGANWVAAEVSGHWAANAEL